MILTKYLRTKLINEYIVVKVIKVVVLVVVVVVVVEVVRSSN